MKQEIFQKKVEWKWEDKDTIPFLMSIAIVNLIFTPIYFALTFIKDNGGAMFGLKFGLGLTILLGLIGLFALWFTSERKVYWIKIK